MSPAFAGRFSTTAPQGKPGSSFLKSEFSAWKGAEKYCQALHSMDNGSMDVWWWWRWDIHPCLWTPGAVLFSLWDFPSGTRLWALLLLFTTGALPDVPSQAHPLPLPPALRWNSLFQSTLNSKELPNAWRFLLNRTLVKLLPLSTNPLPFHCRAFEQASPTFHLRLPLPETVFHPVGLSLNAISLGSQTPKTREPCTFLSWHFPHLQWPWWISGWWCPCTLHPECGISVRRSISCSLLHAHCLGGT